MIPTVSTQESPAKMPTSSHKSPKHDFADCVFRSNQPRDVIAVEGPCEQSLSMHVVTPPEI